MMVDAWMRLEACGGGHHRFDDGQSQPHDDTCNMLYCTPPNTVEPMILLLQSPVFSFDFQLLTSYLLDLEMSLRKI